jgi:hypothetical protein
MRSDMDKVIVERPRLGSRSPSRKKGYRKYIQSTPVGDLPRQEPLLGRWKGRQRWLNEHLGPMRRFLRSNVGRPWNNVHRDLCEHVSFDNAVQAHVLSHVHDYVHRYVEVIDAANVQLVQPGWGWGRKLSEGEMYVCPLSGLLKVVRHDRRRRPPTRVCRSPSCLHLWRDGAWWEVRVRKLPENPGELWDAWLERPVADLTIQDLNSAYGGKLVAVSKRPLSRKETKQLYKQLRRLRRRHT